MPSPKMCGSLTPAKDEDAKMQRSTIPMLRRRSKIFIIAVAFVKKKFFGNKDSNATSLSFASYFNKTSFFISEKFPDFNQ